MKRIITLYRHLHNTDGTLRATPCPGFMSLQAMPFMPVECVCSACGEGYTLDYIEPELTATDAPGT